LHASSSVGAILVIAQGERGAGRIQDSPLHSISGLVQMKFAIGLLVGAALAEAEKI